MRYLFILLALVAAYLAFETARSVSFIRISARLISEAKPFEKASGTRSMLVLGDSTAVGVGAPSDGTVAGRLSAALDASVENYAVSGAQTRDLKGQIDRAKKSSYDLILVHIGANDIIRFHSVKDTSALLDESLARLRGKSEHVVLLTAGKVGKAPFFPHGLGWIWTVRSKALRSSFMPVAEKNGVAYVDLYTMPDPFNADPDRYYAPDGLHLTGDGYGFWYEATQAEMEKKWPDLLR